MACWILITGLFTGHCPTIQPAGRQPSCVMMMVSLLSVEPQSAVVMMMMMMVVGGVNITCRFSEKDHARCVCVLLWWTLPDQCGGLSGRENGCSLQPDWGSCCFLLGGGLFLPSLLPMHWEGERECRSDEVRLSDVVFLQYASYLHKMID